MKHLFLILFISIFCVFMLFCQEKSLENIQNDILKCLPEMGKDTIPALNTCESKYLNFYFQKNRGTFDFLEKKIAFFKGNTGTIKRTKKEYFDIHKRLINNGIYSSSGSGQLIILEKNEITETGYDAVIISLSKKNITKKEIIKRLKKK